MAIRSDWNDRAVFSECPTCKHLGPHLPDELGMLRCDVCGTTFAAGPGATTTGAGLTYSDAAADQPIDVSWIPSLPDDD